MTFKELITEYTKVTKILNFSKLAKMVYPNITDNGARVKLYNKLNEVESKTGVQRLLSRDIEAAKKGLGPLHQDTQKFMRGELGLKKYLDKHKGLFNVVSLGLLIYPDLTVNTAKTKMMNKVNEFKAGSGKQRILPHDEEAARKIFKKLVDDLEKFIHS
jgi:hypothetical protein